MEANTQLRKSKSALRRNSKRSLPFHSLKKSRLVRDFFFRIPNGFGAPFRSIQNSRLPACHAIAAPAESVGKQPQFLQPLLSAFQQGDRWENYRYWFEPMPQQAPFAWGVQKTAPRVPENEPESPAFVFADFHVLSANARALFRAYHRPTILSLTPLRGPVPQCPLKVHPDGIAVMPCRRL